MMHFCLIECVRKTNMLANYSIKSLVINTAHCSYIEANTCAHVNLSYFPATWQLEIQRPLVSDGGAA